MHFDVFAAVRIGKAMHDFMPFFAPAIEAFAAEIFHYQFLPPRQNKNRGDADRLPFIDQPKLFVAFFDGVQQV